MLLWRIKMNLPVTFTDKMKELLGNEYDEYIACYDETRLYGLRVNTKKISVEEFKRICPFEIEPIQWIENGFYYDFDLGEDKLEPADLVKIEKKMIELSMNDVKKVTKRRHKKTSIHYYDCPCAFDIETTSFIDSNHEKASTMYVWMLGLNGLCMMGRTWEEFINVLNTISGILELDENNRIAKLTLTPTDGATDLGITSVEMFNSEDKGIVLDITSEQIYANGAGGEAISRHYLVADKANGTWATSLKGDFIGKFGWSVKKK